MEATVYPGQLVFKCTGHLIKDLICPLYHIGKDHPCRQVVQPDIAEYAKRAGIFPGTMAEYLIQYESTGKLDHKDADSYNENTQQQMKAFQMMMPERKDDRPGTIDKDHPYVGMTRQTPVWCAMR